MSLRRSAAAVTRPAHLRLDSHARCTLHVAVEVGGGNERVIGVSDSIRDGALEREDREECHDNAADDNGKNGDDHHELNEREAGLVGAFHPPPSGAPSHGYGVHVVPTALHEKGLTFVGSPRPRESVMSGKPQSGIR